MDFYECLGVPRTASADDIHKVYRTKARAHHPDMHSGDQAKHDNAEIFKRVVEAFEILSDPEKKARYDVQGYWGRRPSTPPPKPQKKSPVKTKEEFEQERKEKDRREAKGRSRFEKEPMDVHCFFFGGDSSGRSILVHVKLTPQEMKHGCTKSVTIKKRDFCQTCGGDGYGYFICPKCKGKQQMICSYCDFTGGIEGKCPDCDGTGMGKWMLDEVVFKVSPNTQPGHSVTVLGQGEHAPKKAPGNVRVVLL